MLTNSGKLKPLGWIGVDFDGTLARYDGWENRSDDPEPILPMVERVRGWLNEGREVRIFTSRVGSVYPNQVIANKLMIERFCLKHFNAILPVTCEKDQNIEEIWDDKAIHVIKNTGQTLYEAFERSKHNTNETR